MGAFVGWFHMDAEELCILGLFPLLYLPGCHVFECLACFWMPLALPGYRALEHPMFWTLQDLVNSVCCLFVLRCPIGVGPQCGLWVPLAVGVEATRLFL